MYMTFFDSRRYFSAEKFANFYKTRQFFIPTAPEQNARYDEVFHKQSIRYGCQIQGNRFEERFEGMEGKGLVFRHAILEKETYAAYLQELIPFYGYAFGGVLKDAPETTLEEFIQHRLLQDLHFTYEQETIVYRKNETEFYITITELQHYNFVLRVFEKEDYATNEKEELLLMIRFLLTPDIHT